MKKISIIIPSFNCAQYLGACLDSLLQSSEVKPDEVIVVDDGSTDLSADIASRPDVRLITSETNNGPGVARNLGVAQASGDILVFVDADVALHPDAIGRLVNYFTGQGDCAAVIGSYDNVPSATGMISQYRNLLHRYVHQNTTQQASHFWTGIGAVKKSVFLEVGGFNEKKFGRMIEDVEFGYRLRDAGYCIKVNPTIQGRHLKHWTFASMLRTDLFIRAIPWTHLLLARKEMPKDFSLGWNQRTSVILAWVLLCFTFSALIYPMLLGMAGAVMALFLVVNAGFFRYLQRKRGWPMVFAAITLHWIYHFNSGLGFLLGSVSFVWQRLAWTGTKVSID